MKKRLYKPIAVMLLAACLLASCERHEQSIIGTWKYDMPTIGSLHEMTFRKDGTFELKAEYKDRESWQTAVTRGKYIFSGETDGTVYMYDRRYDEAEYMSNDTTWMRVSVRGDKLYIMESEESNECIVYHR